MLLDYLMNELNIFKKKRYLQKRYFDESINLRQNKQK
jgi:hypothetical protein